VTAGNGLTGGGTSGNVSLSVPNSGITNTMLQNSALTVNPGTALTGGGAVSLGSSTTLNVDTTKVVTGVIAGTDLTGGGTGGVQTLNLDTTKVPLLGSANNFTGNQGVTGNVSATGIVSGTVVNTATGFNLGGTPFAFGSSSSGNTFLGFAGNSTITGNFNTASGVVALSADTSGNANTASGYGALAADSTGLGNTASGFEALVSNTTGGDNEASGAAALNSNTTGNFNTADGAFALGLNTTASQNTAVGFGALQANLGSNNTAVGVNAGEPTNIQNTTGANNTFIGHNSNPGTQLNLNNATAVGADAQVTAGNSLVLGSINGVNGSTADTNVGIGTTAPSSPLTVVTSNTFLPAFLQSSSTFGTWLELNNTSAGGKLGYSLCRLRKQRGCGQSGHHQLRRHQHDLPRGQRKRKRQSQ
jgi:hypothetical protein